MSWIGIRDALKHTELTSFETSSKINVQLIKYLSLVFFGSSRFPITFFCKVGQVYLFIVPTISQLGVAPVYDATTHWQFDENILFEKYTFQMDFLNL